MTGDGEIGEARGKIDAGGPRRRQTDAYHAVCAELRECDEAENGKATTTADA
jgi:hypothetical protein